MAELPVQLSLLYLVGTGAGVCILFLHDHSQSCLEARSFSSKSGERAA